MEPLTPKPPDPVPVDARWDAVVLRAVADIDKHAPEIREKTHALFGEVVSVVARTAESALLGCVPGPVALRALARRTFTKLFEEI